jgi:hypothetical protein
MLDPKRTGSAVNVARSKMTAQPVVLNFGTEINRATPSAFEMALVANLDAPPENKTCGGSATTNGSVS